MKRTAVEFLIENLIFFYSKNWDAIVDQAKEIEKQQIIDAYEYSTSQFSVDARIDYPKSAEQYYNEQFKNK
jgi:hypothetical protein